MNAPIHGSRLLRSIVDRTERMIVFEIALEPGLETKLSPKPELFNLTFRGVVAYHFTEDAFERGTILDKIDILPGSAAVRRDPRLFDDHREHGWPGPWNTSLKSAEHYLDQAGLTTYQITSTTGLNGWVVASEIECVAREQQPGPQRESL